MFAKDDSLCVYVIAVDEDGSTSKDPRNFRTKP